MNRKLPPTPSPSPNVGVGEQNQGISSSKLAVDSGSPTYCATLRDVGGGTTHLGLLYAH